MLKFKNISATLAISLLAAPPAMAQWETLTPEHAEKRLRNCLLVAAPGAPTTGLRDAVISIRAVCKPQIDRVADNRRAEATKGLTGDAAKEAADRSNRALNDEIALAVANITGLTTL